MSAEPATILSRTGVAAPAGHLPTPEDGNLVRFGRDRVHLWLLSNHKCTQIRQDGVEATWRVVQPLIEAPGAVHTYPRGSCGPRPADYIGDVAGGWHAPDVPTEAGR